MDLPTEATTKSPRKPLGQLGRDEMNLAEFPITLLTDRVPKDQKEAVYQDEIYDDRTGRTLARRLTIQAGNYGLTTAVDDEVILALIQLTKDESNFTKRKVEFSRHELIQLLGWNGGGASYERILLSLRKWTSVYLDYENAWRDNRTKTWLTKGFHIIDAFEFNDSRTSGDQLDLLPSYIIWNEIIFESFQAGYLKPLDYDLCTGLSNSTAKRMYRFLDKRFYHNTDLDFDLKYFAHEHIGLGRNYDGPAHLKRKLQPAITELESVGFLKPLPESERFTKEGKDWKIRLIQKTDPVTDSVSALPAVAAEPPISPLMAELTKRGVTEKIAAALVKQSTAEFVEGKIEQFDWEMKQAKPPKRPAGYLVKSILEDYKPAKGFTPAAELRRLQAAHQTRQRQATEPERIKQAEQAKDRAERDLVWGYWEKLDKAQQAELDATAIAQADAEELGLIEPGPMKSFGMTILRGNYLRRLLQGQGKLPPA